MTKQPGAKAIPSLSLDQAHDQFLRGEATFVDVREQADFERAHIPGSLSMPLGEIPWRYQALPRDRTLVLYCA